METAQLYIENNRNNDIVIIDQEDLGRCYKYRWTIHRQYKNKYARAEIGSGVGNRSRNKRKYIFLHHIIMGRPKDGLEIDHINNNGLDNRKSNLRIVDHTTNMRNIRSK